MRGLAIITVLICCIQSACAQANWSGYSRAVSKADSTFRANNYPAMLRYALEADTLVPDMQRSTMLLVKAYLLNDQTEKAYSTMERFLLLNAEAKPERDTLLWKGFTNEQKEAIIQRRNELSRPIQGSILEIEVDEKDFHAEGVAIVKKTRQVFVGSIHKSKIVRVDKTSKSAKDFVPEQYNGLAAVTGLAVNKEETELWVASNHMPFMQKFDSTNVGRAEVLCFTLNGVMKYKFLPDDSLRHLFGDLIVSKKGDVYVSDTETNVVYKLDERRNKLMPFLQTPSFVGIQGLAFNEDESALYIADYIKGLYAYDVKKKSAKLMNTPSGFTLRGTDGIYFYKNSLITIQNGVIPNRISRVYLSDDSNISKIEILERYHLKNGEPTLGAIDGDSLLFIENSPWSCYDESYQLKTDMVEPTRIRKLKL
jgi:sugar lactone lactonase YvrE